MRVSANADLLLNRNHDRLAIGPAMKPHMGHIAVDFWNIQDVGTLAELFFIIAQESNLYREVLPKHMLAHLSLYRRILCLIQLMTR